MKDQKDNKQVAPLKLLGKRVFLSLGLLPFISMLRPIALALATLKNPPGMVYTTKVFKHLKRVLLQRSFTKKFLKNQQKAKFLLRGFQFLYNQKTGGKSFQQINKNITTKFNHNCMKTFFDQIQKYENQQENDLKEQNLTFLQSIPLTIQRRRESDFNSCLRIKDVLRKLIKKQRMGNSAHCKKIYQNEFLKIRIPWTENIYQQITVFGEQLWSRYKNNEYNLIGNETLVSQDDQSIEIRDQNIQQSQSIKLNKEKENQDKKKTSTSGVNYNNNNDDEFLKHVLKLQPKDYDNVDIYFSSFECDNDDK